MSNTGLPYFKFYLTLYYIWTHHSSHSGASCFLSREWQITPSGSHSLWSPLRVAAPIIPCTTFKRIAFAICSAWHHYHPAQPPAPHPHIAASLWVSTIPGLFLPPPGKHSVPFNVQSVFILAKQQSDNTWIISALSATPSSTLNIWRWAQLLCMHMFNGLRKAC